MVDGEIVIAGPRGLDFDALQLRLHPAASRVAKLAAETPSSFVAFDLLAEGDRDLRGLAQAERRLRLEQALAGATGGVHLTPCRRERSIAAEWFHRFEGAGLDGVIASAARCRPPAVGHGTAHRPALAGGSATSCQPDFFAASRSA